MQGLHGFNRGVNKFNRGVNALNKGVNEVNRGVNRSVARQGCNLLRAAVTSTVTSAMTSQGCCCGMNETNEMVKLKDISCSIHTVIFCIQ